MPAPESANLKGVKAAVPIFRPRSLCLPFKSLGWRGCFAAYQAKNLEETGSAMFSPGALVLCDGL